MDSFRRASLPEKASSIFFSPLILGSHPSMRLDLFGGMSLSWGLSSPASWEPYNIPVLWILFPNEDLFCFLIDWWACSSGRTLYHTSERFLLFLRQSIFFEPHLFIDLSRSSSSRPEDWSRYFSGRYLINGVMSN